MSPCQWAWGWEAPQVLEVGQEHTRTAPLLLAPRSGPAPELCDPCPSTQPHFHLSRHCSSTLTAIGPAPDPPHLSSPAGPHLPSCIPGSSPASLSSPSVPAPCKACPYPLHPNLSTCPSLSCLIPGSPSDSLLSDSARPGLGPSPEAAPLPFLYNLIKKRSRFCF